MPPFGNDRRCRCGCHTIPGRAHSCGCSCCPHHIRLGQPCSQCDEDLPTSNYAHLEKRPCRTCAGTGWICDVHQRGDCAECRSFDGSLSGCPSCTPPGGCGGTGTVEEVSGDDQ